MFAACALDRAKKRAGLGPYYAKPGTASPCYWGSAVLLEPPPVGWPLPAFSSKPDSWAFWPKLAPLQQSLGSASAPAGFKAKVHPVPACSILSGTGSGQHADEVELSRWTSLWATLLNPLLPLAPAFTNLGEFAASTLERLLRKKAHATLRRHLPNWRLWVDFAQLHEWPVFEPPEGDMVACLQGLVTNGKSKGGAKNTLCALKFVATLMGWQNWVDMLSKPVVTVWCDSSMSRQARKEALPLPLSVIAAFEARIHEDLAVGATQETMALVAFLVMFWGALHFSDLQQVERDSLQIENSIARGRCYRCKSAKDGMPFGLLCFGIFSTWDAGLRRLCEAMKECDFLLAGPRGARANFAYALGMFRRLLVSVGGVPSAQASSYTLHSLKTTGLSWGLQLDVDVHQRRLWGHHRSVDSGSKMVTKYSRDDVLPALRAQLRVLQAIRGGWVPLAPQSRGAQHPVAETALTAPLVPLEGRFWSGLIPARSSDWDPASDAETEVSDDEDSSSSSSSESEAHVDSDLEKDKEVEHDLRNSTVVPGVFIVNTSSAFYHAAVELGSKQFGRACAPCRAIKQPQWEVWHSDPSASGEVFFPCAHGACSSCL